MECCQSSSNCDNSVSFFIDFAHCHCSQFSIEKSLYWREKRKKRPSFYAHYVIRNLICEIELHNGEKRGFDSHHIIIHTQYDKIAKILQNQPKYSHFRLSRLFTKSTHMLFNKNSLKRKEVDLQAIKNEVKIDFYLEYKLCIIIHKKV